jgi:hypothetical protein
MNWPASNPDQAEFGRSVSVTLRAVWWRISSTRARVAHRDLRPDQFQVAIDSVRADQQVDQAGAQKATGGSQR